MKREIFYFLAILMVSISSCSDELDFSQANDLEITPALESSLVFVETTEQFINSLNNTDEVFNETFGFEAFSNDIFADRIIEGELTYIIENTTSKAFELTIEFLDDADIVLDTEIFNIDESVAPAAFILERIVAYGDTGKSIDIITNLSTFRITAVNLGDNTSISNNTDPKIFLQSSGKFRVRLR